MTNHCKDQDLQSAYKFLNQNWLTLLLEVKFSHACLAFFLQHMNNTPFLAEACALVERVVREREEHEQFGGEIERKEQLTGEQRVGEEEEIKERELGCTQREGASVALTQNGM